MSPRRPLPPHTQLVCPDCDQPVLRQDPEDLDRWRRNGVQCQACERQLSREARALLARARSVTGWEPSDELLAAAVQFDVGTLDAETVMACALLESIALGGAGSPES